MEWMSCCVSTKTKTAGGKQPAAFGSLFRGTENRNVIIALGRVCSNPEEEGDVRTFAYTSLLNVASVPLQDQPNPVGLTLGPAELAQVAELVR